MTFELFPLRLNELLGALDTNNIHFSEPKNCNRESLADITLGFAATTLRRASLLASVLLLELAEAALIN